MDRIDGSSGKNFPGFTTLGILDEIQKMMTELKCELEHFQVVSMYNDIIRQDEETKKIALRMLSELLSMVEDVHEDIAWIGEEMVRNPCPQTGRMG